jgi:hypothetical protein
MDEMDLGRDGIRHVNVARWLLEDDRAGLRAP